MNKRDFNIGIAALFSSVGAGVCFYISKENGSSLIGAFALSESVYMGLLTVREIVLEHNSQIVTSSVPSHPLRKATNNLPTP